MSIRGRHEACDDSKNTDGSWSVGVHSGQGVDGPGVRLSCLTGASGGKGLGRIILGVESSRFSDFWIVRSGRRSIWRRVVWSCLGRCDFQESNPATVAGWGCRIRRWRWLGLLRAERVAAPHGWVITLLSSSLLYRVYRVRASGENSYRCDKADTGL